MKRAHRHHIRRNSPPVLVWVPVHRARVDSRQWWERATVFPPGHKPCRSTLLLNYGTPCEPQPLPIRLPLPMAQLAEAFMGASRAACHAAASLVALGLDEHPPFIDMPCPPDRRELNSREFESQWREWLARSYTGASGEDIERLLSWLQFNGHMSYFNPEVDFRAAPRAHMKGLTFVRGPDGWHLPTV